MTNEQLDEISHVIGCLDFDERLCVTVNGLMRGCDGRAISTISSLAQCMVTLAAMLDNETQQRCVTALRDAATQFEEGIMKMKCLN